MTKNNKFQIIAEIASNWNGSEILGKKIIKKASQAGADYVKFQMWRASDLYKTSHPNWNEIKKSEMTPNTARKFKKYSDSIGINCIWSVFYPEAVKVLEDLDVSLYKIASRTSALMDSNSLETLKEIAKTKKPVIISMGFGGNKKLMDSIFRHNKKYYLYCISNYPTKLTEINFKLMQKQTGFSDHTNDSLAALIYATQSANVNKKRFYEKHVCIDESVGPDKPFSMGMNDFKKLIFNIRQIESLKI
jgi:N,N'-diacetyllegionaminate synthase